MKIVIIEDNNVLAKSIQRVLKQEGFFSLIIKNGEEGEQFLVQNHKEITLVILDINLPGKNGFSICESIRKKGISTPVIMLTANTETHDITKGLSLGADDYIKNHLNLTSY